MTFTVTDLAGRTATVTTTMTVGDQVQPMSSYVVYNHAVPAHGVVSIPMSTLTRSSPTRAALLNVIVANPQKSGSLTIWPYNLPRPSLATVPFQAGRTAENSVLATDAINGVTNFYNGSAGPISLELVRYGATLMTSTDSPVVTGDTYTPVTPARVLPATMIAGAHHVAITVPGHYGVPANAAAVVLDITESGSAAAGHLVTWSEKDQGHTALPGAYWAEGQSATSLATVSVNGRVIVSNASTGAASFNADVVGYFVKGGTGSVFLPASPSPRRLLQVQVAGKHWVKLGVAGKTGLPGRGTERNRDHGSHGQPHGLGRDRRRRHHGLRRRHGPPRHHEPQLRRRRPGSRRRHHPGGRRRRDRPVQQRAAPGNPHGRPDRLLLRLPGQLANLVGTGDRCYRQRVEVRSLGYRTDLAILALEGSQVTDRGDHLVVRTSRNPDYWWGNFLLLRDLQSGSGGDWTARFAAEFPGAQHMALGLDEPDARAVDPAELPGMTMEQNAVMTATSVHAPPRPNTEAVFRTLEGDADWQQSLELATALWAGDPSGDAKFLAAQQAAKRGLTEAGHGAWFGAFLDGTLVAQLGLITVETGESGLARYQSVETHPAARRRGLAGTWSGTPAPPRSPVARGPWSWSPSPVTPPSASTAPSASPSPSPSSASSAVPPSRYPALHANPRRHSPDPVTWPHSHQMIISS